MVNICSTISVMLSNAAYNVQQSCDAVQTSKQDRLYMWLAAYTKKKRLEKEVTDYFKTCTKLKQLSMGVYTVQGVLSGDFGELK